MKTYLPLGVLGLLIAASGSVTPEPYDRGPAPPDMFAASADSAPPPEAPRRMVCVIDTPFPSHQERCPTRLGDPGSPCRCEGSLFDGARVVAD